MFFTSGFFWFGNGYDRHSGCVMGFKAFAEDRGWDPKLVEVVVALFGISSSPQLVYFSGER